MTKKIRVGMGGMVVRSDSVILESMGIGSCVVIVLYDDVKKIGGMAHAMLSERMENVSEREWLLSETHSSEAGAKYVAEAIPGLLREIERVGGKKSNIKAILIGGASMFKTKDQDTSRDIGPSNVAKARSVLENLGIVIKNEATGGFSGRSVELDISTGAVDVKSKYHDDSFRLCILVK